MSKARVKLRKTTVQLRAAQERRRGLGRSVAPRRNASVWGLNTTKIIVATSSVKPKISKTSMNHLSQNGRVSGTPYARLAAWIIDSVDAAPITKVSTQEIMNVKEE